MTRTTVLLASIATLAVPAARSPIDRSEKLADTYVEGVERLNREHARRPGDATEADLAKRLPKKSARALEDLLVLESGEDLIASIVRCGRAALDLDRLDDFEACREALLERDAEAARELGCAFSGERALVLGQGGLDEAYLEHFSEVVEDILAAYDEVFDFEEFSKIPGKKLRLRVHLEPKITRPPHFAPQFPWHSEIDFPVVDAERLRSPTQDGKFLFYGLCHELGHVIAMWGDLLTEEDHHAWAHYTGVAIVEHIAASKRAPEWLDECRDVRWRSLEKERERLSDVAPGDEDRDAVLTLLVALHDEFGPRAIGDAIDALDEEDEETRVNHVRYYGLDDFRRALRSGVKTKKQRKRVDAIFDGER